LERETLGVLAARRQHRIAVARIAEILISR
jgi:hypothetical protein